ncbi:MAG: 4Fe-4S binding protein [Chloroflexi bacterium]|nr:4Fe-4S binding protein [Chloroflexota bacterium]
MRPILRIDLHVCQTCTTCQARTVCKTRAIVQYERGDLPIVDASRCRGCMVCIRACPFGAVRNDERPTTNDESSPLKQDGI